MGFAYCGSAKNPTTGDSTVLHPVFAQGLKSLPFWDMPDLAAHHSEYGNSKAKWR
jgi:hypothetical protein